MPKGVYHNPRGSKTKPYQTTIGGRTRRYETDDEAVIGHLLDGLITKVIADDRKEKEAQRPLEEKRAADKAKSDGNCAQERDFAYRLVDECRRVTGHEAIVLNDGTRADVLLGLSDGSFLPVQLKTTAKAMEGNPNAWQFCKVSGNTGMAVVCWRCKENDAWIFDGSALEGRKIKLNITPGKKNCRLAMARQLKLGEIVEFLHEHSSTWESTTEYAARHDFKSDNHAKEMRGIDAYRARFPGRQYRWPDGQNTHVDLLEDEVRLQFKSVHEVAGQAGFRCNTRTSAGTGHDGRQLVTPYPHDAFDVLVAVWFDPDGTAHFWRISNDELVAHGVLSTPTQPGKTCFHLYGPEGVGRQPTDRADTWTRGCYQ
jgi:hypothetical protein